jgi:hypothetical protein
MPKERKRRQVRNTHLMYVDTIGEAEKSYRVICRCGWRCADTTEHLEALEQGRLHALAAQREPEAVVAASIRAHPSSRKGVTVVQMPASATQRRPGRRSGGGSVSSIPQGPVSPA